MQVVLALFFVLWVRRNEAQFLQNEKNNQDFEKLRSSLKPISLLHNVVPGNKSDHLLKVFSGERYLQWYNQLSASLNDSNGKKVPSNISETTPSFGNSSNRNENIPENKINGTYEEVFQKKSQKESSQLRYIKKESEQKGDAADADKGRGMSGWQNGGGMMKGGGGQQILLIKDKGDSGMEMPTNGMSAKDAIAPLLMMLTPLIMMCIMMPMMMSMMGGMMNLIRGIGMMLIGNMNPMNMMMMMPGGMMPGQGAPTRHRKTDEDNSERGRQLLNHFIFDITKKLEAAIDKYEKVSLHD